MCGFFNRVAFILSFAAIVALSAKTFAQAGVSTISPQIEDPLTHIIYQLLSNADWNNSELKAESLGGHLATISDQEEQDFVFDVFGGYGGSQRILWIGLHDPSQDSNGKSHAANFVWVSGAPVTYTNWNAGEPNNNGGEYYAAMYYPNFNNPGSWNDWNNRTTDPIGIPFYGVVQFIPEPGAAGVCLACIMGTLMMRPRRTAA